ncbi:MAG: hypothetical protein MUF10_11215 [Thermoanaerobaculaceae bacterium]|nr:hypothetical protein [Thermoanaerobaculaceae bacterium]
MRQAQKQAPRRKKPPPSGRRCTARCKDGKRCKKARLRDSDTCLFHSPGGALAAAVKGGEAVSDRWKEVNDACNILPLLGYPNQARYLIALINEYDQKRDTKGAIFVITTLMQRLASVTEPSEEDSEPVTITRRVDLSDVGPAPGSAPGA